MHSEPSHSMHLKVSGGSIGLEELTRRLQTLRETYQIGPWQISHWADARHQSVVVKFSSHVDAARGRALCG